MKSDKLVMVVGGILAVMLLVGVAMVAVFLMGNGARRGAEKLREQQEQKRAAEENELEPKTDAPVAPSDAAN